MKPLSTKAERAGLIGFAHHLRYLMIKLNQKQGLSQMPSYTEQGAYQMMCFLLDLPQPELKRSPYIKQSTFELLQPLYERYQRLEEQLFLGLERAKRDHLSFSEHRIITTLHSTLIAGLDVDWQELQPILDDLERQYGNP